MTATITYTDGLTLPRRLPREGCGSSWDLRRLVPVSVGGKRAQALILEVLQQMRADVDGEAEFDVRAGFLISTRPYADVRSGGSVQGVSIRRLGRTWSPWLPKRLAARITAQDAVERALDIVQGTEFDSKASARIDGDRVLVSYEIATTRGDGLRTISPPLEMCS